MNRLYILIGILLLIVGLQGGFILGKWEKFDRDGKIAEQETKIKVLESEMRGVKERVRMK
jgi:hypothetical protein